MDAETLVKISMDSIGYLPEDDLQDVRKEDGATNSQLKQTETSITNKKIFFDIFYLH